jgi:hypothetical protein
MKLGKCWILAVAAAKRERERERERERDRAVPVSQMASLSFLPATSTILTLKSTPGEKMEV